MDNAYVSLGVAKAAIFYFFYSLFLLLFLYHLFIIHYNIFFLYILKSIPQVFFISKLLQSKAILTSRSIVYKEMQNEGFSMSAIRFLSNCPRCGYVAEAWTEDGVSVNVKCQMCGYYGRLPHPDLKDGAWRVG